MANYELWYADSAGNRIAPIQLVNGFEYVKVVGGIGYINIALPVDGRTYESTDPDRRINVYRQPFGGALELELVAFARRFRFATNSVGLSSFSLSGNDQNELLLRRIVAYYAGSSQAQKTAEADDMMKEIVDENLGASSNTDYDGSAVTGRDLSNDGFNIESDLTLGPSITKAFSWRNVMGVLQSLQAASKTEGTEVYFGVTPDTPTSLTFRTKTGQWGADRTLATGVNPLVFSMEWGNLTQPVLDIDYSQEWNFAYAGGTGKGTSRIIKEAENTNSTGISAFSRRERFVSNNSESEDSIQSIANDEIARRRPTQKVTGSILNTPSTPYGGNGWNVGDRVTVNYQGIQSDVMVQAVSIRVDSRGKETVTAKVESQLL